jgi:hypothetical protein
MHRGLVMSSTVASYMQVILLHYSWSHLLCTISIRLHDGIPHVHFSSTHAYKCHVIYEWMLRTKVHKTTKQKQSRHGQWQWQMKVEWHTCSLIAYGHHIACNESTRPRHLDSQNKPSFVATQEDNHHEWLTWSFLFTSPRVKGHKALEYILRKEYSVGMIHKIHILGERELAISRAILCSLSSLVTSYYILLFRGYSPTYLCILRYPVGWAGPSLKENLCLTIFTYMVLSHIGLPPQCSKVLRSLHLSKVLCYIYEVYMFKFKNVCKKKSIELQKTILNPYALYSKFYCKIAKQHTQK